MKKSGNLVFNRPMGERAKAVIDTISLHYRAEIAEALLSDKLPPRAKKLMKDGRVIPSTVEVVLNRLKDRTPKEKMKLATMLMRRDPKTHLELNARDKIFIRGAVQPNSKKPFSERTKLPEAIADILKPNRPIKSDDDPAINDWMVGVLDEFYPGLDLPAKYSDGRPDDAEPGKPTEEDDEPSGDPELPEEENRPPWSELRFMVERIRCIDTTNGEYRKDEIEYAGVATDGPLAAGASPNDANAVRCARRDAGKFANGDTHDETPHHMLHSYPLDTTIMPHLFAMIFAMAEIDSGGFGQFLNDLQASISAELVNDWNQIMTQSGILTYIGSGYGAMIAGIAFDTFIAMAIGAAIGLVIGLAIAIIVAGFTNNQDDIFQPEILPLLLDENALNNWPFFGTDRTPSTDFITTGDGGEYEVRFYWQLAGPVNHPPNDLDGA